jgi:hypothetical protein
LKKVIAIDKTLHNLAERLSVFDHHYNDDGEDNNNSNIISTAQQQELDDDIETEQYGEPYRFHIYRKARAKKTAPALLMDGDGFTYEDVYDTITQEELDWQLRQQLKVSPEDRYQHEKKHWYSHELSYLNQIKDENTAGKYVDIIKEYGCGRYENNPRGCVPECRYYNSTGRIEDSEVIQRHRELEKRYRDNNAIVEPPTTTNTTTSSD